VSEVGSASCTNLDGDANDFIAFTVIADAMSFANVQLIRASSPPPESTTTTAATTTTTRPPTTTTTACLLRNPLNGSCIA
jgi:hypothetical protein